MKTQRSQGRIRHAIVAYFASFASAFRALACQFLLWNSWIISAAATASFSAASGAVRHRLM